MSSLNLDLNYFDHPKAMRIVARLGPGADVLPIRLWAYVGRHHPETGRLQMLGAELEHACGWWGEKGEMLRAMIEIGFVKRDGEIFEVHDWLDHSGHLGTFKKRAIKAARKRWGLKSKSSNASSIAKSKVKQCPSRAVPYSAVPSKTKHQEFVWLTDAEWQKLQQAMGSRCAHYIDRLNGYIGQIGEKKAAEKYKSHYHTILNWHRMDAEKGLTNAPNDRPVPVDIIALARAKREAEKLRKETPARPVSGRLGSRPDVPGERAEAG